MLYGFPGAGKTAFARQLSEDLGIVHIQEDKVRHELFGPRADSVSPAVVRRIMNYMIRQLLMAGVSVAYDGDVYKAKERQLVRELALGVRATPILVWLQVDPETSFVRTQKRDRRTIEDRYARDYTEDDFRSVLSIMQNPANEDAIVVSGKHTFNSQRAAVVKKLHDLSVVTREVASTKIVKPELMNLVSQSQINMRGDIQRRNISIRP